MTISDKLKKNILQCLYFSANFYHLSNGKWKMENLHFHSFVENNFALVPLLTPIKIMANCYYQWNNNNEFEWTMKWQINGTLFYNKCCCTITLKINRSHTFTNKNNYKKENHLSQKMKNDASIILFFFIIFFIEKIAHFLIWHISINESAFSFRQMTNPNQIHTKCFHI